VGLYGRTLERRPWPLPGVLQMLWRHQPIGNCAWCRGNQKLAGGELLQPHAAVLGAGERRQEGERKAGQEHRVLTRNAWARSGMAGRHHSEGTADDGGGRSSATARGHADQWRGLQRD
jgi:hypothetical protein